MEITALHFETLKPVQVTVADRVIRCVKSVAITAEELQRLPIIAPGVLDIQVNGYGGHWFSSENLTCEDVQQTVAALAARGVARCLPTLITNSAEALRHGMATIAAACGRDPLVAASVRGIHLEGPWISRENGPRGAHPLEHVRDASVAEFEALLKASSGLLKLLTLAPEVDGAVELIRAATASGVAVSIGHTAATEPDICRAVEAGATLSTHIGNGCAGMIDRHHNPLWPQLAEDRLTAGVISDGFHLPDALLATVLRCKTVRRIVMTCDVSGFAGCSVGKHSHGGLTVEVLQDGRIVVAGQRQFLAGSGATTLDCLPQLLRVGNLKLSEAWRLITHNPESALSLSPVRLAAGSEATFNILRVNSAVGALGASGGGFNTQVEPVETVVRGIPIAAIP